MTTKRALGYLLAWVPVDQRDSALRDVLADLETDGDHVSVQACATLLQERRANPARQVRGPSPASTTWDGDRQPTADERADTAIRASLTMPCEVAADHLRHVADILCAEGEHAAHARCHEEIRRRVPTSGGPL